MRGLAMSKRVVFLVGFGLQLGWPLALSPAAEEAETKKATAQIRVLAISGNGKLLAFAGTEKMPDDAKKCVVRVWDLESFQPKYTFPVEANAVAALAYNYDGTLLLAGDDKGKVTAWNLKAQIDKPHSVKGTIPIKMAVFHPRNDEAIVISDQFFVWNPDNDRNVVQGRFHARQGLTDLEYNANGSLLAACGERETVIVHPGNFRVLYAFGLHRQPVTTVALATSSALYMATGHKNGSIEYWFAGRRQLLATIPAHKGAITHLAFYDLNRKLVSTGADGAIRFWDIETRKQLHSLVDSKSSIVAFAMPRNRNLIASTDGSVIHLRTLDPKSPKQVSAERTIDPFSTSRSELSLDLNQLKNWKVVRGDWKQANGRIVGSGDSRIDLKQTFPNDLTLEFKLKVNGPTNPRVRFGSFHFGYEGRNRQFFLHGPKATGERFDFEFEKEYAIKVQIAGDTATLWIDGREIAKSNPQTKEQRQISVEAGGKQSQSSAEFYDFEIRGPESAKP